MQQSYGIKSHDARRAQTYFLGKVWVLSKIWRSRGMLYHFVAVLNCVRICLSAQRNGRRTSNSHWKPRWSIFHSN